MLSRSAGLTALLLLLFITSARAQTESVLYSFTGGADGASPWAGLIFDSGGNAYGTTFYGGNLSGCGGSGCGVVFELSPVAGGVGPKKCFIRSRGGPTGQTLGRASP
jgi:hypothetical protein